MGAITELNDHIYGCGKTTIAIRQLVEYSPIKKREAILTDIWSVNNYYPLRRQMLMKGERKSETLSRRLVPFYFSQTKIMWTGKDIRTYKIWYVMVLKVPCIIKKLSFFLFVFQTNAKSNTYRKSISTIQPTCSGYNSTFSTLKCNYIGELNRHRCNAVAYDMNV